MKMRMLKTIWRGSDQIREERNELQRFVHWMSKQLLLQDGAEFCDSSSLLAAPNR